MNAAAGENLSPLMKQYEELKARYPQEILLFRLGDFYEIFGEDAKSASPVLEVVLTQRQGHPMCGVPHHAVNRYLGKLLKKNFTVALAEQMEDPALAKGIVSRQVVRVISPGTVLEENLLESSANNFLVGVSASGEERRIAVGLAALDVSTGQFMATEFEDDAHFSRALSEIAVLNPAEILISEKISRRISLDGFFLRKAELPEGEEWDADAFFPEAGGGPSKILPRHPEARRAASLLVQYVQKINPGRAVKFQAPQWMSAAQTLSLDAVSLENLEVVKNKETGSTEHTLFQFLNRTLTAMGARNLKQWLIRPLGEKERILERLEAVGSLLSQSALRTRARECLSGILDLERISVRILSGTAYPREVLGLKKSLEQAEHLLKIFGRLTDSEALFESSLPKLLQKRLLDIPDFSALISLLGNSISEEPPATADAPGVIRKGYNALLDEKRAAAQEGKKWLQDLEERQKDETRISGLKIGYTSVFGYYFEVTKPHLAKVPPEWHRKQTLVNAERYINSELKSLEDKILGAEEQALRMEKELFKEILEKVRDEASKIQRTARALADLDCLLAFAETADLKRLSRPEIEDGDALEIIDGWHPVVQDFLPAGNFVPNDCRLNSSTDQIMILTGPNMAGKSTYLRQVALTVLMAQAGSYVPAAKARIGLIDKILTRIGSGDRLAQGESTFMVEMKETAKILKEATGRSLLILDEVGRGTSTYDGISIAWAVIEHLNKLPKPKVLFATHYFELTHLAGELEGVKNYNVQAREWEDSVVFLHKIAPGSADRSYGVAVAKLAGLPAPVIERAKKILSTLEKDHKSLLQSRTIFQQELPL